MIGRMTLDYQFSRVRESLLALDRSEKVVSSEFTAIDRELSDLRETLVPAAKKIECRRGDELDISLI